MDRLGLILAAVTLLWYAGGAWLLLPPAPWYDHLVRAAALVLLPLFVRAWAQKGRGDQERKMAEELARTHQQVRRYTADLERTHAEKERRLAEITLLHQFGTSAHHERKVEPFYLLALEYLFQASEAPWIFLAHRRDREARATVRTRGNPPPEAAAWAREEALRGCGRETRGEAQVPGVEGSCRTLLASRGTEEGVCVAALLVYPPGAGSPGDDQAQVVGLLMDRVESQLALVALGAEVAQASRRLEESNRQLRRLIELEGEFSRALLEHREVSEVFQALHEIMAKEILEVDRLNLFLPNRGTGMLECATSVGIGDYPVGKVKVPMDGRGGALALAFSEGRTVAFDGQGTVPPQYRLAPPYDAIPPIRSRIFVIVPLLDRDGQALGVLGADRKYSHQPISPETVLMLESFARHAAVLLALRQEGK